MSFSCIYNYDFVANGLIFSYSKYSLKFLFLFSQKWNQIHCINTSDYLYLIIVNLKTYILALHIALEDRNKVHEDGEQQGLNRL